MTKGNEKNDTSQKVFLPMIFFAKNRYTSLSYDPFYSNESWPKNCEQLTINFSNGDAGFYIESIAQYQDLMNACEQVE